jgi:hypothetical protein
VLDERARPANIVVSKIAHGQPFALIADLYVDPGTHGHSSLRHKLGAGSGQEFLD